MSRSLLLGEYRVNGPSSHNPKLFCFDVRNHSRTDESSEHFWLEGTVISSEGFKAVFLKPFLGVTKSPWMCHGKHESFREEGSRKPAL